MKKLEKKLTCPRCGCTDALTPLDKITLFGRKYHKAHCRQCDCTLANVWWFDGIVAIGIMPAGFIVINALKFLEMHTTISIARGSFYEWCIFAFWGCLYVYSIGLIALYFIPSRVGWDGYDKK